jgi:tetratricopeptide (TPR) repeat protein
MASDGIPNGNGAGGKRGSGILRVLFGPGRGKRYELLGEEFILGNGDDADIKLEDSSIEARHAVLSISGEHARIRPFGRGVGFRVNGRLVDADTELQEGSQIEIGGVVLSFAFKQVPRPMEAATSTRTTETAMPAARVDEPPHHERTHEFPPNPRAERVSVQETDGDFETKVYRRSQGLGLRRLLSRSISWLIVVAVFSAGLWVGMDLYNDVLKEPVLPPASVRSNVCRKAGLGLDREPRRVDRISDYQGVSGNDRDIVRRSFDEAIETYWGGDIQGALGKLQTLADSFPDFTPPFGGRLSDIQDRMTRLLAYKGQISKAFAVTTDSTATRRELEEVLAGLKTIPRNDVEFGPSAELFVRELERRIDEAGEDGSFEDNSDSPLEDDDSGAALEPSGPVEAPAPDYPAAPSAEDKAEPQAEVAAPAAVDASAMLREARDRARVLYETADFDGALNQFLACAQKVRGLDQDVYNKARYWARKMRLFDESLTEGMRLLSQDPASAEGLALVENAIKADRVLFRFYEKLVGKQAAEGFARRALALLESGEARDARRALTKARSYQRSLEIYARVEEGLLAASQDSFDRAMACAEGDKACAVRLLKEVIAVAPTKSRVYGKAVAVLDELDPAKPLPDNE